MWEQAPSPPLLCHLCPRGSSRLPEVGLRVLPDWVGEAHLVLPHAHCTVVWLWVLHSPFSQCGHSLAAVTHLFGRHSSLQCLGLGEACCWVQFLPLLASTGWCWAGLLLADLTLNRTSDEQALANWKLKPWLC